MTITLTSADPRLAALAVDVRAAINRGHDDAQTARLVANVLRRYPLQPSILTPDERIGDPLHYTTHTLHVEPDGLFSIVALVWQPGQATRIHDHVSWCVFGVIQGVEHEELFDEKLRLVGVNDNYAGDVSGFAPPGDIHRVRNVGDTVAISLHVYGTDLSRVGSSVRRYYD
jgi:predicted metal-dependent enzyme (double-stranded beta helix superfamily)